MTRITTASDLPIALQALVKTKAVLLEYVINGVLERVPEVAEIWCYGINALCPSSPSRDWDFIVMLPDDICHEDIAALNDLSGPFSKFRRYGNNTFDIQAMSVSDNSRCANTVRHEGFYFFRKSNPNIRLLSSRALKVTNESFHK